MDVNSTEFEKAVAVETRNIMKSDVMSKVNKSRNTWTDKGYKKGYGEGAARGTIKEWPTTRSHILAPSAGKI